MPTDMKRHLLARLDAAGMFDPVEPALFCPPFVHSEDLASSSARHYRGAAAVEAAWS